MLFNYAPNITMYIWYRIRATWQLKFFIPRSSYYFKFIVFILLSYVFPNIIKRQALRIHMLFLNSLSLPSFTCDKLRANCMVHSFCYVLWSWILFPCWYLDNNFSILFFILLSAKDLLLFMINSVSYFKFSSTFLSQSK